MCQDDIEIRLNDDGTLDEVCAHGVYVHLEQMGKDHWYLGIGDVQIWFHSKKKIKACLEDSRPPRNTDKDGICKV